MTIVVILGILVYLANIQSTKSDSIPLSIIKDTLAQQSNSTLQPSQEQTSSNSSLLNIINQTLNESENVNATSSDRAVYDQTNRTSDNQTMRATNGTNGTVAEIVTNASQQQPQSPLESPLNLLPPSQPHNNKNHLPYNKNNCLCPLHLASTTTTTTIDNATITTTTTTTIHFNASDHSSINCAKCEQLEVIRPFNQIRYM